MSIDMFPDAAVQYIIDAQEANVTDQQPDERIMLEEVPLMIETTYHNADNPAAELEDHIVLTPGEQPFILFQMKQKDGAVVLEVDASQIEGEEELIETLEVFFETMQQDRMMRGLIALSPEEAEVIDLPEHNEQGEYRDEFDSVFDGSDMPTEPGEVSL